MNKADLLLKEMARDPPSLIPKFPSALSRIAYLQKLL
jgi:hypothetical protein